MTRAVNLAANIPALQRVWKIIPGQPSLFLSSLVILTAELYAAIPHPSDTIDTTADVPVHAA